MSHLYVFISHITWLWFTKSYKTRNNGWSNVTGIFSYLARSGVVDGALLILQPTISWETWIRLKWRFDWLISIWLTIFGGWPGILFRFPLCWERKRTLSSPTKKCNTWNCCAGHWHAPFPVKLQPSVKRTQLKANDGPKRSLLGMQDPIWCPQKRTLLQPRIPKVLWVS